MWVVAMFDLPVDTKAARREYTLFVKNLKRDGFTARSIFDIRPALVEQRKRRSAFGASEGISTPGWGSAYFDHNRQTVRANERFLGKNATRARETTMPVGTFLTLSFSQLFERQDFRQGGSVSDPRPQASRNTFRRRHCRRGRVYPIPARKQAATPCRRRIAAIECIRSPPASKPQRFTHRRIEFN